MSYVPLVDDKQCFRIRWIVIVLSHSPSPAKEFSMKITNLIEGFGTELICTIQLSKTLKFSFKAFVISNLSRILSAPLFVLLLIFISKPGIFDG